MTALNTLLILLTAVCIPGLINRTRAVLAGRRGIRFAQHLYDVRLLLRKGAVYSTTASALFRAVPSVYLGSAIVAALFIPVGELKPLLSFDGDIVCFTYLMALGRFALILGAMDTGSSFEGMGASREALTARWSNRRSCSRPARWPCWRATRRSPESSPKRRRATCS
ncbi:MAG: respiratory chain complex I subunit 1 family protein [Alistipes finegoldii]